MNIARVCLMVILGLSTAAFAGEKQDKLTCKATKTDMVKTEGGAPTYPITDLGEGTLVSDPDDYFTIQKGIEGANSFYLATYTGGVIRINLQQAEAGGGRGIVTIATASGPAVLDGKVSLWFGLKAVNGSSALYPNFKVQCAVSQVEEK